MKRKKLGREAQKRVSAKIALLRREGKTAEEAAGAAYGMERSGRLGSRGTYRRVGRRTKRKQRHRTRRSHK
jgi:hypothetical protein